MKSIYEAATIRELFDYLCDNWEELCEASGEEHGRRSIVEVTKVRLVQAAAFYSAPRGRPSLWSAEWIVKKRTEVYPALTAELFFLTENDECDVRRVLTNNSIHTHDANFEGSVTKGAVLAHIKIWLDDFPTLKNNVLLRAAQAELEEDELVLGGYHRGLD